MSDTNPMSELLQQLHDQWTAFARLSDARLLVWQVKTEEAPLVDAFVVQECDHERALTHDLFVPLTAPFDLPSHHGLNLVSELADDYEEASRELDASERAQTWKLPSRLPGEGDVRFFLRAIDSLRTCEEMAGDGKVAIVLRPTEIRDQAAYLRWLLQLVQASPSGVRFVVLDAAEQPAFSALGKAEPERVVQQPCELQLAQALVELTSAASDPAALFRALQARLVALIEAGDLVAASGLAQAACKLTSERGWPHLGALVHMMLASGYVAQADWPSALRAYAEADALAVESERASEAGAPNGPDAKRALQLRLQARLGQGAALLAARTFKLAAELYLKAAPLAQVLDDGRIELDCYRLASVCHAELGQAPMAWELGMRGFAHGVGLDEETRRTSTLPYLADHMLRMTERYDDYRAHARPLAQQATRVLGADWQMKLAAADES